MSSGWNGSNADDKTQAARPEAKLIKPAKPSALRGVLAGAIVVVLVAGAWFLFFRDTKVAKPEKERPAPSKTIAEVKPNIPKTKPAEPVKEKVRDPHEGMVQASNGVWHPTNRPYRAGSKYSHAVRTNQASRIRAKMAIHKNSVEQVLLQIFTCEVGDPPWQLPDALPEAEMKRLTDILVSKNEIKPDDSEVAIFGKETLEQAKKEMMKFIKEGGDPADFIVYYHDELEKAFYARQDAHDYVMDLIRGGEDPKTIELLIERTNKRFAEKGIKPIDTPAELTNLLED